MNIGEAVRLIDLPGQTFQRWARDYQRSAPLLHMLDRDARRESSVLFGTRAAALGAPDEVWLDKVAKTG